MSESGGEGGQAWWAGGEGGQAWWTGVFSFSANINVLITLVLTNFWKLLNDPVQFRPISTGFSGIKYGYLFIG